MSKPAAIFVAVAMTVTAGCVAVIASFGLGLGFPQALLCGFGALIAMAVTQLAFVRSAPQDFGRLDDIDRVVTQLQSRLEVIEARISSLDGAATERARAATKPVMDEIAALSGLVTTIAKEVADHDVHIGKLRSQAARATAAAVQAAPPARQVAQPVAPAPQPAPAQAVAAAMLRVPEAFDPIDGLEQGQAGPGADIAARLEHALAADRIEPHLQPIVALPSRRVSHYEAFARLIEADGFLAADQFMQAAAASGRIADIDRRMLLRCAPVAQRLAAKGGGAVFVNVSRATLESPDGRAWLSGPFDGRPELARMVVLEMPQADFWTLGAEALATLDRWRAQGLRLSIDRVENLRLDPRELARRGVRFVKVAAEKLLDPETARGAAIHPADLAGLLARHGVELIATHVDDERTVPELLDMDVGLSQGALFGVPRPVRPAAPDEAPAARPAAAARIVSRAVGAR